MKPSAQAPSSTASSASSSRVMPQTLTRVTPSERRRRGASSAGERGGPVGQRRAEPARRARRCDLDATTSPGACAPRTADDVVHRAHGRAAEPREHVAARARRRAAAGEPGWTSSTQHAVAGAVAPLDAEVGARHAPVASSCGITTLAVSTGHGEADPDAARRPSPPVAICELMPITRPGRVEQRAAGVARVERGVRLDHVRRSRSRSGAVEPALERGDDAGRQRPLEPERVADRDRRVADLHAGGVAELERLQVEALGRRRAAARGRCRRPCRPARADRVVVGERHADVGRRRRRRARS